MVHRRPTVGATDVDALAADMERTPLLRITAENFLSLKDVALDLGPVNVLVGPNNAGKSNLLEVVALLGALAQDDLGRTLESRGGFDRLYFHGDTSGPIRLGIEAAVTANSHAKARDEYSLTLSQIRVRMKSGELRDYGIRRWESFKFKRLQGPGRRITVQGGSVHLKGEGQQALELRSDSLALATLPRLSAKQGGEEISRVAELFSTFRVFDVDSEAVRRPRAWSEFDRLRSDGGNLAYFLKWLHEEHSDTFAELIDDAQVLIPGLQGVEFRSVDGPEVATTVYIKERGLNQDTPLSYASYGTIRSLALLALLHDPNPPLLTCIEELDRGLHPYVFDRLVDRMRLASSKTQFLIATHSPALVNRLRWDELIVCERAEDGSSRIPAIPKSEVRKVADAAGRDLGLGEIWFTGTLGGVPDT
jgi:predicted ATPase